MHKILKILWLYRNQLIILLTPILLLPLPLIQEGQEALCGYVMILMAVYWITECMPIAATACIPVFLFPMLGLLTLKEVVVNYMKEIIMMFFGGLAVAIALEKCNLHKRIATRVLLHIGTRPKWLMLGFMLPTWFLSMWISNTATSAMMLPMVEAVLDQLDPDKKESEDEQGTQQPPTNDTSDFVEVTRFDGTDKTSTVALEKDEIRSGNVKEENGRAVSDVVIKVVEDSSSLAAKRRHFQNLAKGLTLCVAYSANSGGIATLTGTNPNIIMKGQADELYQEKGLSEPVSYPNWIIFGFPLSAIVIVLLWFYMQAFFLGCRETCCCCCSKFKTKTSQDEAIKEIIRKEHAKLGPIRFAEVAVVVLFVILICLWFFRDPGFTTGWGSYFPKGYVGDAVPAVMLATALFFIPSSFTKIKGQSSLPTLMDWNTMHHKMPWGTFLLLGGGFALAQATTKSGLAAYIGDKLEALADIPGFVMVFCLSLIVAFLTEITSNSATCTILMPIMASMAEGTGYNPLYLMFPVAISTSFAFMLPVATPPNAIAFSYGRLRVIDMMKAGFAINFICVAVVTVATHTWGMAYFNLDELPWGPNGTIIATE